MHVHHLVIYGTGASAGALTLNSRPKVGVKAHVLSFNEGSSVMRMKTCCLETPSCDPVLLLCTLMLLDPLTYDMTSAQVVPALSQIFDLDMSLKGLRVCCGCLASVITNITSSPLPQFCLCAFSLHRELPLAVDCFWHFLLHSPVRLPVLDSLLCLHNQHDGTDADQLLLWLQRDAMSGNCPIVWILRISRSSSLYSDNLSRTETRITTSDVMCWVCRSTDDGFSLRGRALGYIFDLARGTPTWETCVSADSTNERRSNDARIFVVSDP